MTAPAGTAAQDQAEAGPSARTIAWTVLVVTGQMIADLIIFGLAIKIIVGAVRRGQQRRAGPGSTHAGGEG